MGPSLRSLYPSPKKHPPTIEVGSSDFLTIFGDVQPSQQMKDPESHNHQKTLKEPSQVELRLACFPFGENDRYLADGETMEVGLKE